MLRLEILCQHLSLPGSAAFLWHTAALSPYSVFHFSAPATDLGKGFCASRLSAFPVQWEISHAQTILGVNTSSSSSPARSRAINPWDSRERIIRAVSRRDPQCWTSSLIFNSIYRRASALPAAGNPRSKRELPSITKIYFL